MAEHSSVQLKCMGRVAKLETQTILAQHGDKGGTEWIHEWKTTLMYAKISIVWVSLQPNLPRPHAIHLFERRFLVHLFAMLDFLEEYPLCLSLIVLGSLSMSPCWKFGQYREGDWIRIIKFSQLKPLLTYWLTHMINKT